MNLARLPAVTKTRLLCQLIGVRVVVVIAGTVPTSARDAMPISESRIPGNLEDIVIPTALVLIIISGYVLGA